MKVRQNSTLLLMLLWLTTAGEVQCASPTTAYEQDCSKLISDAGKTSQHDRLWQLFDLNWKYQMIEYPEWATSVGYPGQDGRWTDMSLEAIARRKRELEAPLKASQSIDRAKLNPEDQLSYDIFNYRLKQALDGRRFPEELMPINQLEGIQQSASNTLMENPTRTVQDYENILTRLHGVPTVIEQTIVLMKEGLKTGVTPPKVTLREVPQQIKNQIVDDPMKSSLLEPFKNFPSTIAATEQERLRTTAAGIVRTEVIPGYAKLLKFFVNEYLPNTRESLALTELPDGKDWYAYKVQESTTTALTPAEIHNIGLAEVKRLRGAMDGVIVESGFKGTFPEFCTFLRSDPRFYFDKKEDLLAGYRDIGKRIDPELIKQFGKLPRLPYGIQAVPDFSEKSQPTAYYQSGSLSPGRAGIFFANTYNLKTRPKSEMEALTLHEAVPGHHLQIALAQEMDNLPQFRRHGHFTAYTEGWGLYSESLGKDLGMYKDPYSRFGQLTYDAWRATRLVLDTGIHSMGWTRQQAIDFFKANSCKSDHDIEVEVDRYIVWPGQALAYKIGEIKLQELKKKARTELGDKFDVRAFHDAIMSTGAVPLDVLQTQMEKWIADTRQATSGKN